ncbi:ATP-dependent DNA helicase PcrA [Calothrix sp. NIES-4071]|nr:ATP-dependent DNA helicase PcrA [Calothrix sp. NIES-4071]BAZ64274.1 ATP-dependent DNA helicase PcrA [Calothrix sp. NIES-4105]
MSMTTTTNFLSHLNPSQRRAVEHYCGPLLVVAGAGSGKTRALTYRIANLILEHNVDPENILAVTFTNKAAREMKERIQKLFADHMAMQEYGEKYDLLPEYDQVKLRSRVYKNVIKDMWCGTFHSLFSRILRMDIDKYQDENGRKWNKNFSIFDDSDAHALVKEIVTKQLDLDDKKFEPRSVRYAIGNAKNQGLSPKEFEREQPNYRGRIISQVYSCYQDKLAENNALDFDDLILTPTRLFQQNKQVLNYWHSKFRHILVDEYQDTNRTQYELIRLLSTNGETNKDNWDWEDRSVFVVGDADQCLPSGTEVLTPNGYVSIEKLEVGDEVLAPAGKEKLYPSKITHIQRGYFSGSLWCVRVGKHLIKGTPHHIVPARMVPQEGRYYVYLMYRADRGYRVGMTQSLRSNDYGQKQLGFIVRANQEHADKLWVLKTVDTYEEARYYESYYAAKYGLPTIVFHGDGRNLKISDELILHLFQEIDTFTNAYNLMADLWLDPDFPHHRPQNGNRRQTLNLVMHGTPRLDHKHVYSHHRLQWCSNRSDIAESLQAAGFRIRSGKNNQGYRLETARVSYREALTMANQIAKAGRLDIRHRALISGVTYEFMPLSHLHTGMKVLLEVDGQLEEYEIEEVYQEDYTGGVYDLEVDVAHTYVANGVLVHNSIYSFRMADFTILMGFQGDFGDGLDDEDTSTMVKLEENYRSCENILEAANSLIENNTERIDKVLKPTRSVGEKIYLFKADDEVVEADFVVNQIRKLEHQNPDLDWGSFSILYRTNAQSRPFEDLLVKYQIPYTVVGGFRFYDRKEIKDILAYLKAVSNPADTVSLLRVINTPRRGIGKSTLDTLSRASQELGTTLWEILSDETSVNTLAGRAAKAVNGFADVIKKWQGQVETLPVAELVQGIIEDSGYVQDLHTTGTDEAQDRIENIQALYNAVLEFQEENEDNATLQGYLEKTSLSSDLDNLKEGDATVSLMTLHASKGLEFPIVFLVGLEQGLFPNYRSMQDPASLEEERRLCYVGITRAQERLFISHARERRLYGSREPAIRSQFLDELPTELIETQQPGRQANVRTGAGSVRSDRGGASTGATVTKWQVGDRVLHKTFGEGEITHVFDPNNKTSVAVKFPSLGTKIIDPRVAQLQKLN